MAVQGSEPPPGVIVPHLVVSDVNEAVAFYREALGAVELYHSRSASGEGQHAHLRICNSLVWISTEEPGERSKRLEFSLLASPETLGGSTCVFQICVSDADAAYERAVRAGAVPAMPLADMFWGDRYGWIRDPFGYLWAISTTQEVLTPEEIRSRMQQFAERKRV